MRRSSLVPRSNSVTPIKPNDDFDDVAEDRTENSGSANDGTEIDDIFGSQGSILSEEKTVYDPYDPFENFNEDGSFIKEIIPTYNRQVAIICLILNCFIPGFGTILSGLLLICLKDQTPRNYQVSSKNIFWNIFVGISQLMSITLMLVGWFWSLAWGIEMVLRAVYMDRRTKRKATKDLRLKANAMEAFNTKAKTFDS